MRRLSEYYCFADFEFTCGAGIDINRCEMLSVGAVICTRDYTVAERFYCTARPVYRPKLTKQCRQLTHLTQEEISKSPDSGEVLSAFLGLLGRYSISEVWVWGNFDKPALGSDLRLHKRYGIRCGSIMAVQERITDIQDKVINKLGLPQAVSIKELSGVFGYTPTYGTFHNAMNDATAFYCIHRAAYTTDLEANADFVKLRQERIKHIEDEKEAANKRRLELAMSLPLTDSEREMIDGLDESDKLFRRFVYFRARLIREQSKFPDGSRLTAILIMEQNLLKVYREGSVDFTGFPPAMRRVSFVKGMVDISPLLGQCDT